MTLYFVRERTTNWYGRPRVWERIGKEEYIDMTTDHGKIIGIFAELELEFREARETHSPYNSVHEGYAVILEELDEFWDEVKLKSEKRTPEAMRAELIQTAAACLRTIYDCISVPGEGVAREN